MSDEYINRRQALAFGCSALALPTAFRPPTAQTKPAPFIKGVTGDELNRIAKLGEDFRAKFNLPGVSLAMSYRGKLKLLACFGYANKETNEASPPAASVSNRQRVEANYVRLHPAADWNRAN